MTEGLGESMAESDALTPAQARTPEIGTACRHGREAPAPIHSAEGGQAAHLEAVWTELLVQLSHTVQECAQPEAIDRLKKLGIRRPKTAAVRLAREYVKTFEAAADSGFAPNQQTIARRAGTRPFCNDLDDDFRALARSYERLLAAAQPPTGSLLFRWLQGRAEVHLAQADALTRGI